MEDNLREQEQDNIFDDHVYYIPASKVQRFFNLLIDVLVMRFVLSLATSYLLAYALLVIAPDFL